MSDVLERSRADRYLARIDAKIFEYNKLERLQFLEHQIRHWEWLYGCFVSTDGESIPADPSEPPLTAWDFMQVIDGLAKRYASV